MRALWWRDLRAQRAILFAGLQASELPGTPESQSVRSMSRHDLGMEATARPLADAQLPARSGSAIEFVHDKPPAKPSVWRERNAWRRALMSDGGPASPLTRFVLLVLWAYSDCNLIAYPSESTLTQETRLARRSVVTHLRKAESQGWIVRGRKAYKQGRWRHTVYQLTHPRGAGDAPHDG